MPTLNLAQEILAETYASGEHHGLNAEQMSEIGDGLFNFLFRELSENEECDSLDTAYSRVGNAFDQGVELLHSLQSGLIPSSFNEGMNLAQNILLNNFAGGEFIGTSADDVGNVGDGLFEFYFHELSTEEDCDSIQTAIERVDNSIHEIGEVFRGVGDKNRKSIAP